MKKSTGFTIIELLIALLISGFIFVILSQNLSHALRFLREGGEASTIDRTVCLLFDRLDRDLSGIYIPKIYELPKKEESEKEGEKEAKKEVKPTQKQLEPFFEARTQEGAPIRLGEKKRKLFESINFITRNPIQTYGQGKKRYARVMYELEVNREKSTGEDVVYNLIRKESEDLKNDSLKEAEEGQRIRKSEIVWKHEVASNIKEFYIEYGTEEKKKEGEEKGKREYLYEWEDGEKLPETFNVHLVLWNTIKSRSYNFDCLILNDAVEVKKEKPKEPKKEQGKKEGPGKVEEKKGENEKK